MRWNLTFLYSKNLVIYFSNNSIFRWEMHNGHFFDAIVKICHLLEAKISKIFGISAFIKPCDECNVFIMSACNENRYEQIKYTAARKSQILWVIYLSNDRVWSCCCLLLFIRKYEYMSNNTHSHTHHHHHMHTTSHKMEYKNIRNENYTM